MSIIRLDLDRLTQSGEISADEAVRLKNLALPDARSGLLVNLLLIFGAISVAAGTIALVPNAATGLVLAVLALGGAEVLRRVDSDDSLKVLGAGLEMMGALGLAGWIGWEFRDAADSAYPALGIAAVLAAAAVWFRSSFLAAPAVLALGATMGSGTGYWHASYAIFVEEPTLTILVFSAVAAGLFTLRSTITDAYRAVASVASRTAFFIINFAFWVGSLWGDRIGEHWLAPSKWSERSDWRAAATEIPELVFTLGRWWCPLCAGEPGLIVQPFDIGFESTNARCHGDEEGRRPTQQQEPVGGLRCAQHAPIVTQQYVAKANGGESGRGEIQRRLDAVELAQREIGEGVDPYLDRVEGKQAEHDEQDRQALSENAREVDRMDAALAQNGGQEHHPREMGCACQRHQNTGDNQVQQKHAKIVRRSGRHRKPLSKARRLDFQKVDQGTLGQADGFVRTQSRQKPGGFILNTDIGFAQRRVTRDLSGRLSLGFIIADLMEPAVFSECRSDIFQKCARLWTHVSDPVLAGQQFRLARRIWMRARHQAIGNRTGKQIVPRRIVQ